MGVSKFKSSIRKEMINPPYLGDKIGGTRSPPKNVQTCGKDVKKRVLVLLAPLKVY